MLRKECAPNEGLHQEISEVAGTESSEHAPGLAAGLTILPALGGGAAGGSVESGHGPPNTSSTVTTHGENRSDDDELPELDPHICKQWPCPQCHKPRDAVDDEMTTPEAGPYSAEAATSSSTQSFFHPHEEHSEDSDDDDDLLLDIVATSAAHGTQKHKGHYSS